MVDAAKTIATAQRLIKENGRTVQLIALSKTASDGAKPWQGPSDARAAPTATLSLDAVALQPASAQKLGESSVSQDLISRSQRILMTSPGVDTNLSNYQEVLDDEEYWKIEGVEKLQPGNDLLLAFIGVSR